MGRYRLETYQRNARISAIKRFCPACKRKAALDSCGVCRFCNTKHALDIHSKRARWKEAAQIEIAKKGEHTVDSFVRSYSKLTP